MTEDAALLELIDVTKDFTTGEDTRTRVLSGVSMSLRKGETAAIIGPSGSGKSTLLNLMGALDHPTSGRVLLEGRDVSSMQDETLSALRNEKIGFVFQLHHLLPQCTIIENVLVPVLVNRVRSRDESRERAARLLDRVGLSHRLSHRPGQLSGGECQRVAVVRALINRPALLLADEPTGSLDRASSESLSDLLAELNREEGVAMVLVTHALRQAHKMQQVLELKDGALEPAEAPAV